MESSSYWSRLNAACEAFYARHRVFGTVAIVVVAVPVWFAFMAIVFALDS